LNYAFRLKGGKFGFAETVAPNRVTAHRKAAKPVDVATLAGHQDVDDDDDMDSDDVSEEYPFEDKDFRGLYMK